MPHFPKLKYEEIPLEVREARNARRAHTEKACRKIDENLEEIIDVAIVKAKAGDMRAARLLADKRLAPAKGERMKIENIDHADPQVAADSVMGYLARGEIDPEQASHCLDAVAKRFDLRVISQGMAISGEQWMRLMRLREMVRGTAFASLMPAVAIGAGAEAGS